MISHRSKILAFATLSCLGSFATAYAYDIKIRTPLTNGQFVSDAEIRQGDTFDVQLDATPVTGAPTGTCQFNISTIENGSTALSEIATIDQRTFKALTVGTTVFALDRCVSAAAVPSTSNIPKIATLRVFDSNAQTLNGVCVSYLTNTPSAFPEGRLACLAGQQEPTDPTGIDGTYNWLCLGENGGRTAACEAPSPRALPLPQLTFNASAAAIAVNNPLTLVWSSVNTSTCIASGAWNGTLSTSGTRTLNPTTLGATRYTLRCSGAGGAIEKSVSIQVNPAPVDLNATFTGNVQTQLLTLNYNLTWNWPNATSCVASGDWSGTFGNSGSASVAFAKRLTRPERNFTLNCTGPGGSASRTVTLR